MQDVHDAEAEQRKQIIAHLEQLNAEVAKQNSVAQLFYRSIVYGIGFFIGSAIIATIALGLLGPWVGKIPWVRTAFTTGVSLLHD